jgi:hypothetical protein
VNEQYYIVQMYVLHSNDRLQCSTQGNEESQMLYKALSMYNTPKLSSGPYMLANKH